MGVIDWSRKKWFDPSGNSFTFSEIVEKVHASKKECEIHVGSDSHIIGSRLILAVAICIYKPGKGGTYFFSRTISPRKQSRNLGLRLNEEVAASIFVAEALSLQAQNIFVHADVSSNPKHKSFKYAHQICSFIKGMGYTFKIKPDSWASSSVADSHAK